ncbi:MAG: 50S ribosomal protein L29 [Planctomycetota bacterium]
MAKGEMTGGEVRAMSDGDIASLIAKHRDELLVLRTQAVTEKIEDNSRFGKIRRDIARLKTEQTSRQVAADQA